MKKLLLLLPAVFCFNTGSAQHLSLQINDSLKGFDQAPVIQEALTNDVGPEEMSLHLAACRRNYINQKYNLASFPVLENYSTKTNLAACVNEDFEEGSLSSPVPGTINVNSVNMVNGWTANGAFNSSGGTNGNCINTYSYSLPNAIQLIAPGSAGYIDPLIGSSYPIHSVFGNSLNPTATTLNGFNCYGDWFAKINNQTAGSSVNRLKKTINVTPSNVYFNFAVMVLVEGSHGCCDGGAVSITFKDCLGNLLATAQHYSLSAQTGCATSNSVTILTSPVNPTWRYSKWSNSSIDLTPWLGQCVTAEFVAFDCTYSGHAGYAYIDAQCAPMVVNGINTPSNYMYYKVYPNPTAGHFNIEINKEISEGEIEMRNVLGQSVLKQAIYQGKNQIKTEDLAKGIYNYSVYSNKTVVSVGKVVIE
jgi:hypothetical protein